MNSEPRASIVQVVFAYIQFTNWVNSIYQLCVQHKAANWQ